MGRFQLDRHADHKVSLSFADQHAESVKLRDLWLQTWNAVDGGFVKQGPNAPNNYALLPN